MGLVFPISLLSLTKLSDWSETSCRKVILRDLALMFYYCLAILRELSLSILHLLEYVQIRITQLVLPRLQLRNPQTHCERTDHFMRVFWSTTSNTAVYTLTPKHNRSKVMVLVLMLKSQFIKTCWRTWRNILAGPI